MKSDRSIFQQLSFLKTILLRVGKGNLLRAIVIHVIVSVLFYPFVWLVLDGQVIALLAGLVLFSTYFLAGYFLLDDGARSPSLSLIGLPILILIFGSIQLIGEGRESLAYQMANLNFSQLFAFVFPSMLASANTFLMLLLLSAIPYAALYSGLKFSSKHKLKILNLLREDLDTSHDGLKLLKIEDKIDKKDDNASNLL